MSFLDLKECVALYWNGEGFLRGVRVVRGAEDALRLEDSVSTAFNDDQGKAVGLLDAASSLATSATDTLVVGSDECDAVCMDILMPAIPPSEMREAIKYEIPRHLPLPVDDVVFGFRFLDSEPESDGDGAGAGATRRRIRVLALSRGKWDEITNEFAKVGFRFDLFVHPYWCMDPLLKEFDEIFFPGVDDGNVFAIAQGGVERAMRQTSTTDDSTLEKFASSLGYDIENISEKCGESDWRDLLPALAEAAYTFSPPG